jgi:hypothetical protein
MFRLFGQSQRSLSAAIEAEKLHARATADANRQMLVDACRAMPADEKLSAIYSEVLVSPDITPEMVAEYGQRLTRLSWDMEREAAQ